MGGYVWTQGYGGYLVVPGWFCTVFISLIFTFYDLTSYSIHAYIYANNDVHAHDQLSRCDMSKSIG